MVHPKAAGLLPAGEDSETFRVTLPSGAAFSELKSKRAD
jgi:hypothetical protein